MLNGTGDVAAALPLLEPQVAEQLQLCLCYYAAMQHWSSAAV